jgi:hypothetical protein
MKKLGIIFLLLIVLLMALSLGEIWHSGSLRKRAMLLKPGDTKSDVQRVLGRPTCVFIPPSGTNLNFVAWLLSVHSETWAYGKRFDLALAFRGESPLRFRMFRPDSNDVAVVFGSSGCVSQVTVPVDAP